MITIRTRSTVTADGNVIVSVGAADAGEEVEVIVNPLPVKQFPAAGSQVNLPREKWLEAFRSLEGSITDPAFCRPEQLPVEPIPDFD